MANDTLSEILREVIRTIPNFPTEGVQFRDITTFIANGNVFKQSIDDFKERYNGQVDVVAGYDARGLIFGGALAYALGVGLVPLRKSGKLPGKVISASYQLEYGKNTLEIPEGILKSEQRVLLLDDLCATGGTALAGADLVKQEGGIITAFACVVDLPELGGSRRIIERRIPFYSQVQYEGD